MDAKSAWNEYYGDNDATGYRVLVGPAFHYNELSKKYDRLCNTLGYRAPEVSANTFTLQYEGRETKHLKVLDVGVGTGLVGECLVKSNFKGVIDGIDNNQPMLDIAKTKGIYRNLWCKAISPEDPLLVDPSDLYDGIIISASIGPTHIKASEIFDLMKIIKSKGYFVITNRTSNISPKLSSILENYTHKLKDLEIAELVSKEEFVYYETGFNDEGNCMPLYGMCFCFQKI